MKCAICGIKGDSIDEAIVDESIPLFWMETRKKKGRFVAHVLRRSFKLLKMESLW